jgi:Flp pilus assembly protein TadD
MMNERPGPEAYLRAARVRALAGDPVGAADVMGVAVRAMGRREKEPLAWALVELAKFQSQIDQHGLAEANIRHARRIFPEYPPALLEQGRRLLAEDRAQEAVSLLRRAVSLNPLPESHWALLEALEHSGAGPEAAQVRSRLVASGAGQDPRTLSLFLATRRLEPERALQLSQRELADRQDIFTLDAHAWALLAAGRIDEAVDFSRRALALGTRDARLFFHAGVIHARAGDSAAAHQWLHRARRLEDQLWPSERRALNQEFAAILPRTPPRMASIESSGNDQ